MKKRITGAAAVIIIALLSAAFGFFYQQYYNAKRAGEYPREYISDTVTLSYRYSVPASVIYAAVKVRSDFQPGYEGPDGETGLLALTSEQLDMFGGEDAGDPRLLYDPSVNLSVGVAWMSSLYDRYGKWSTVYAAMFAGTETVDGWLADPDLADGNGGLTGIPDRDTAAYVEEMTETVKIYNGLYRGKSAE